MNRNTYPWQCVFVLCKAQLYMNFNFLTKSCIRGIYSQVLFFKWAISTFDNFLNWPAYLIFEKFGAGIKFTLFSLSFYLVCRDLTWFSWYNVDVAGSFLAMIVIRRILFEH